MDITLFIQKGGPIVYILIAMNIIGIAIMLIKSLTLFRFKKELPVKAQTIVKNLTNKEQLRIETATQNEIKKLEAGLGTIKIIASTSPLLGLLGTVFGILMTFDTISKVGLDDPMNFSSGISIALITTVSGLIVAIPHHIFYNYYIGALDNNEINLKNEILKNI